MTTYKRQDLNKSARHMGLSGISKKESPQERHKIMKFHKLEKDEIRAYDAVELCKAFIRERMTERKTINPKLTRSEIMAVLSEEAGDQVNPACFVIAARQMGLLVDEKNGDFVFNLNLQFEKQGV